MGLDVLASLGLKVETKVELIHSSLSMWHMRQTYGVREPVDCI